MRCSNVCRFSAAALAACLLFGPAALRAGGFEVAQAQARLAENKVVVSGVLDLDLSPDVEAALTKGIPLTILIEFALYRDRRWWWDKKLGRWTLRAQIKYHALSGLYLVTLQGSGDPKTFPSQRTALKYVGTLGRVSLPFKGDARPEARYWLALRVRLDVEALPAPLRPVAYTSPAWRLKSRWTRWPVRL